MSNESYTQWAFEMHHELSSWPSGGVTSDHFPSRSAQEWELAQKLTSQRYCLQYKIPDARSREAKRNFVIDITQDETGPALALVCGTERFLINALLSSGYSIDFSHDIDGGYCDFTAQKIEVNPKRSKYAAFPYDVIHEADHTRYTFVRNDRQFKEAVNAFDGAWRNKSESDAQKALAKVQNAITRFSPVSDIAERQRAEMLQLIRGTMSMREFQKANAEIHATLEQRAWNFAETTVQALENKGYDFDFTEKQRREYRNLCLSAYAIPRLLDTLYYEGLEGYAKYRSPYLPHEEMPKEVQRLAPNDS